MKRKRTGDYVTISTVGEKCQAFVPDPLPPKPYLEISPKLQDLIHHALLSLGRLDSLTTFLPDTSLFLYMYIRKEAVLSSQIEGTQSSLSDLLLYEESRAPGVPINDVQEVSSYVASINHGLKRIRDGFPLSLRLLKEIHKILLSKGRGSVKNPGEFRTSQNWIGGTRPGNAIFVPPPPEKILKCMGDMENFLHNKPGKTPTLIKAALSHVQFETIHPFLDGNGRLGRLLITLILCSEEILKDPMLYLSLYFKKNRSEYYRHLQNIREEGNWEGWIEFFMAAIVETSSQAIETANRLLKLIKEDQKKIQSVSRAAGSMLKVHEALIQKPLISIQKCCELTGLWTTTVTSVMKYLEELNIIKEITGHKRNRLFCYVSYTDILNEGTEP